MRGDVSEFAHARRPWREAALSDQTLYPPSGRHVCVEVIDSKLVGTGTTRAIGTPTKGHTSPSILVYED